MCRIRAVENDRWLLRATTSGRSEVIDPHGNSSEGGIEFGKRGSIVLPYGHRATIPPGSWMSILGPLAGGVTAVYLLVRWIRRQKVRAKAVTPPTPSP